MAHRLKKIPAYEGLLDAYHRAFHREREAMVGMLPLSSGDRVLDLGCGDGAYSEMLASRISPDGRVVAFDENEAYLRMARGRLKESRYRRSIEFVRGEIETLPFADNAFDFVWCAQSLFSFPEPASALREMRRVTKPRGIVAILENDTLHQVLLSWPVDVELLLRQAEFAALRDASPQVDKYYIGRNLKKVFDEADFKTQIKRTYATNRQAPFSPAERKFLQLYLSDLWGRTSPYISPRKKEGIRSLFSPRSTDYLLNDPHLTMTCIDHVMWGMKPFSGDSLGGR